MLFRSRANSLINQGICPAVLYIKLLAPNFSHTKASVFVTQEDVARGITKKCFSNAWCCVSMLALADISVVEMSSWPRQSFI